MRSELFHFESINIFICVRIKHILSRAKSWRTFSIELRRRSIKVILSDHSSWRFHCLIWLLKCVCLLWKSEFSWFYTALPLFICIRFKRELIKWLLFSNFFVINSSRLSLSRLSFIRGNFSWLRITTQNTRLSLRYFSPWSMVWKTWTWIKITHRYEIEKII